MIPVAIISDSTISRIIKNMQRPPNRPIIAPIRHSYSLTKVLVEIVISQHPKRAKPRDIDKDIYKWRHLIENFFRS
jgi:hypothetical protein